MLEWTNGIPNAHPDFEKFVCRKELKQSWCLFFYVVLKVHLLAWPVCMLRGLFVDEIFLSEVGIGLIWLLVCESSSHWLPDPWRSEHSPEFWLLAFRSLRFTSECLEFKRTYFHSACDMCLCCAKLVGCPMFSILAENLSDSSAPVSACPSPEL